MKKVIYSILTLGFLVSCSSSVGGDDPIEPNNINNNKWSKTFGGIDRDMGYSVQQTTDGGFIITGTTESFGNGLSDVYLIKTDNSGNEQWSKTFGGTSGEDGKSVQLTTDGGYVICGRTYSFGDGYQNVYLIKTDGNGNEIWSKTYLEEDYNMSNGHHVQQTTDEGYIITGGILSNTNGQDLYLIKTDGNGNELWTKTFGGTGYESGNSVQQTTDGEYIITGYKDENILLLKTDDDGNEIWSKTYLDGIGLSVQLTTDGGYVICGRILSNTKYEHDLYLIKTDDNGNEIWSKTYEENYNMINFSYVQQTTDGGYIINGSSESLNGLNYVHLIKTDNSGNEQWSKTYEDGVGNSVQQTTDGGYIITGHILSNTNGQDLYLIKTDGDGNITSTK